MASKKLKISGPMPAKGVTITAWQHFRANPTRYISDWLHSRNPSLTSPWTIQSSSASAYKAGSGDTITLVCISDTHNNTTSPIPDGDILVHAGDLTNKGTFDELQAQLNWLNTLPHPHKVVIGGNHDVLLDPDFVDQHPEWIPATDLARQDGLDWGTLTYLNNTSTTLAVGDRSLAVFGSSMTPYCGTFAFQYPPIRDVWKNLIPPGTDIVITHGPPKGYLDGGGKGCEFLLRELWARKPRRVVFGHIHQSRGLEGLAWDAVQRGHDFPSWVNVAAMACAVGWRWVSDKVGRPRSAATWLVNAAVGAEGVLPATVVRI